MGKSDTMSTVSDIEQANIQQASSKSPTPTLIFGLHQEQVEHPPPSRALQNVLLTAAWIHSNVFMAVLLSLANPKPWIHFILWLPFAISSAVICYSSAWLRREGFYALATSSLCLWLELICFAVAPKHWNG